MQLAVDGNGNGGDACVDILYPAVILLFDDSCERLFKFFSKGKMVALWWYSGKVPVHQQGFKSTQLT